jgi:Flp pilus assembly protein CpaB
MIREGKLVSGAPTPRFHANEELLVLRAKQDLSQWATIGEPDDCFEMQTQLGRGTPDDYFSAENRVELKGRRLAVGIQAGEVLTEKHLLKKGISGMDLDKAKRAMAISINADKAIGYFVVPGSKVDVIHTVDGTSRVILEDVLVLAIDLATLAPEDKAGLGPATATLQVDSEQSLKLADARGRGKLSLVIRSAESKPEPAPPEKDKK